MRRFLPLMMGLAAMPGMALAQTPPDGPLPGEPPPGRPPGGGRGGRVFISPMGEPFRPRAGADAPEKAWFAQADANHDGVLSGDEMEADAARFFVVLDHAKDGEIDPDDVALYESELPELRGGPGGGGSGGGGPGSGRPAGDMAHGGGSGEPSGSAGATRAPEGKQGAARFGYLDHPEPVTSADRNMNRGVDRAEFAAAARARFRMLDSNGDGRIEPGELPRIGPRGVPKSGAGRQDVSRD